MKANYNFKSYLLLLLLLLASSCNNDDLEDEVIIINSMNVNVDGEDYYAINENVGGNENCGNLYVSTGYHKENERQFHLSIGISNTGQLLSVLYEEYGNPDTSEPTKIFLTPNYNPLATFNISDFNYDVISGDLSFRFYGTVFFEQENNLTRELSGNINIKSLSSIDCSVAKARISYFSENLNLFSYRNSITEYSNYTQLHKFYSNNGYILDINTNQDFWNLPLGTILFNENSTQNKVFLMKKQDDFISNQLATINEHTWLEYDTRGEIIIENKFSENGYKIIIGKLNLELLENGDLIHTLNGIDFRTRSLQD